MPRISSRFWSMSLSLPFYWLMTSEKAGRCGRRPAGLQAPISSSITYISSFSRLRSFTHLAWKA